ncbi:hypothetical protein GCM10011578_053380 [Streptomyces fuscichromogenes]|uniref:Nudix hydrolase domain-containing protein n=2 Tax=Streptomyces fuscichromogenes TaxID=1324013 RepID=A0A918CTD1_9ACTN|nr:hypothetical protein GCM10011578_053380 [Streptomyces fuscichromogenes]
MTLSAAAVIVHDTATQRVVLLQRSQHAKFAQGMWDLPVGRSEPGEPITETAVRELHEETGLTVTPESFTAAHIEPRKHAQGRWVGTATIAEDFVDATASALRRYLTCGPQVSLHGRQ